jgi:predicted kinase
MDLDDRGRADLSHRFVNAYLEATGDYGGLQVLPWYVAYRALVRAKVATIRAGQQGVPPVESAGYLTFARRTTRRPSPMVVITTGPSGSGKTTGTQPLVDQLGAVRLRSDIERKRLFGLKPTDSSGSGVDDGLYTRDATAKTYDRLAELAAEVLNSGYTPVVDATFLQRGQRRQFGRLADDLRVPFVILPFGADASLLRERVTHRALAEDDASEATPAVLEHQLATQEPLDEDERPYCRTVDELLGRESSR